MWGSFRSSLGGKGGAPLQDLERSVSLGVLDRIRACCHLQAEALATIFHMGDGRGLL